MPIRPVYTMVVLFGGDSALGLHTMTSSKFRAVSRRGFARAGLGLLFLAAVNVSEAEASAGCAYINTGFLNNAQQAGVDGSFTKRFSAGDQISITLTLTGAAHLEVTPTLVNNANGTQTYTFASDGTYRVYWDARTAASAVFTLTCTAAAPAPIPVALQSTVSQSQTKVVSGNISNRLTAIGSPVGTVRVMPAGGVTGTGRNLPSDGAQGQGGQINLINPATRVRNALRPYAWNGQTGHSTSFRALAMASSFDTSQMTLNASATQKDGVQMPHPTDRPAVGGDKDYTLWGHGSFANVDNRRNRTGDDARLSGDVWAYNVGLDYRFRDDVYAGASIGYSDTNLATTYNSGSYDERGWTFTPYAVYMPNDAVKLSAMAGYAMSKIKQDRDGATVSSSTDAAMWYGAVNASYTLRPVEDAPLDLKVQLNALTTHKVVDAYKESDNTVVAKATANSRKIKPGVEASYLLEADGATLQPFVKADYVYDFMDPINGDSEAFDVGGGVRMGSAGTGLSGSLKGQTQLGRDDYTEFAISGMLSYGLDLGAGQDPNADSLNLFVRSDLSQGAQVYGTGLDFKSGQQDMTLHLDVSQTVPTQAGAKSDSQINMAGVYRF